MSVDDVVRVHFRPTKKEEGGGILSKLKRDVGIFVHFAHESFSSGLLCSLGIPATLTRKVAVYSFIIPTES